MLKKRIILGKKGVQLPLPIFAPPCNDNLNVLRMKIRENIDSFIKTLNSDGGILKIKRWSVGRSNYAHVTSSKKNFVYLIENEGE